MRAIDQERHTIRFDLGENKNQEQGCSSRDNATFKREELDEGSICSNFDEGIHP